MSDIPPFDGVYFYPDPENSKKLAQDWFLLEDEKYKNQPPIDGNEMGDCYHVAFIGKDRMNYPYVQEVYEAIFSDLETYINTSLSGAKVQGVILRKTDTSGQWIDEYRNNLGKNVRLHKLHVLAKSILEEKEEKEHKEKDNA